MTSDIRDCLLSFHSFRSALIFNDRTETFFLSIRISVRQSVRSSFCPSVCPSVVPSVYASLRPSVGSSVLFSVRRSVLASVRPLVRPSICHFVFPAVRLSVRPYVVRPTTRIRPRILPSISRRICSPVCPSVRPSLSVYHLVPLFFRVSTVHPSFPSTSSFISPTVLSFVFTVRSFFRSIVSSIIRFIGCFSFVRLIVRSCLFVW